MLKAEELKLTQEWDKTFKKSDKVENSKVTFVNHFGRADFRTCVGCHAA